MTNRRRLSILLLPALAISCASVPDVKIGYSPPKLNLVLSATQTITCTNNTIQVDTEVDLPQPTYPADPDPRRIHWVSYKAGNSWFANTNLDVETNEHIITAINSTNTGQGEEIIKSVVAIAAAAATLASEAGPSGPTYGSPAQVCALVRKAPQSTVKISYTNDLTTALDKSYQLKAYQDIINPPDGSEPKPGTYALPDGAKFVYPLRNPDKPLYSGPISGRFTPHEPTAIAQKILAIRSDLIPVADLQTARAARYLDVPSAHDPLNTVYLPSPGYALIHVNAPKTISFGGRSGEISEAGHWVEDQPLSAEADLIPLPLPVAQPFGSNSIQLTLTKWGDVQKLQYGGGGSASDLAATGNDILSKVPTQTSLDTDKADQIAAHARVKACEASPSTCK